MLHAPNRVQTHRRKKAVDMHPQRRWIVIRCALLIVCLITALAVTWNEVTRRPQIIAVDGLPDQQLLRQAQEFIQTVDGLQALRFASAAPNLDALFTIQRSQGAAPAPSAPRPTATYTVDMIIASGKQGRAILSGRLTRINDSLPDGSRVVDIQADGVLLEHNGRTRRLPPPPGRIAVMEKNHEHRP